MKILAIGLAILATVVCEVPPPYSGSFRPSQPLILPARGRIQTVYGPPKQQYPPPPQYGVPNTKNVEFLEDLLGPIIPPQNNFGFGRPQTGYIRPKIVNSQPQTTYGVPTKLNLPQTQYGVPNGDTRPSGNNANQDWLQIRQPQVVYGVPSSPETVIHRPLGNNIAQNQAHKVNNVPRLPPNQFGETGNNHQSTRPSGNNIWQNQPQVQYGSPGISQNNNYQTPRGQQPQIQYGGPDISQNNDYQTPRGQQPQVQYGGPDISQNTNYQTQRGHQQEQQFISGASNGVRGLQNQYGVPDQRGIESFERFQQQREAVNFRGSVDASRHSVGSGDGLSEQYLPIKEATSFRNPQPTSADQEPNLFGGVQNDIDLPNPLGDATEVPNIDFPPRTFHQRPANPTDVDIQQVEIKSVGEEGVNPQSYQPVSDRYLPPTTTPRATATERRTTEAQIPTARAPTTTVRSVKGTVRTTEAPGEEPALSGSEDETSGNPNVAIATAVANGGGAVGQTFYLVQPDGRFQRVVYKKTREAGDQEDEYTANYNFQNIQVDPNSVYTPLITLG